MSKTVNKRKQTLRRKTITNKNIILIIVLIAIAGSIYYFNSKKASFGTEFDGDVKRSLSAPSDYIPDEEAIKEKSNIFSLAPELRGIAGYLNTDENINISIQGLKGKVVLVDFWTYTCINCIRTFPYLRTWYEKYEDDGLVIIGVPICL